MSDRTKKVTTEMLLKLLLEMKTLYPDTTIKEFEDMIQMDGYWDTETRIKIARETEHWLDNIGGRDKLKNLYQEYKNGTLGQKNKETKVRLKRLLDTYRENKKSS